MVIQSVGANARSTVLKQILAPSWIDGNIKLESAGVENAETNGRSYRCYYVLRYD